MIERVAILLVVTGVVFVTGTLMRRSARRKRNAAMDTVRLQADAMGQARVISFYGPSCDACDRQKLVLKELESERQGRLSVELRDAAREYDYARQFGLVIVPTTVVIRPNGAIAGINSGFTARSVLEAQLEAA
jgi:thioredoxin-like negative regulator of GroEL